MAYIHVYLANKETLRCKCNMITLQFVQVALYDDNLYKQFHAILLPLSVQISISV